MAVSIARTRSPVRLSLGPIQYHWPKEKMFDFYRAIESTPVDIVYLGETVCSKRRSFDHADWFGVAERMRDAGKEVILSTLALLEANSELGYVRRLCNNQEFTVEANDMSAVQMLAGKSEFIGGASLNIYNPRTLNKLMGMGMTRWIMPVELSKSALSGFQRELSVGVETEVFAWGKLPLAYSARCYTARAHKLSKDDCGNCCIDDPDGLRLSTRDEERFLVINGIQTQSARTHSLINEAHDPVAGIDILRISPQSKGTERVISLFDQVRSGSVNAVAATEDLACLSTAGLCDGYWHDEAGMAIHETVCST
jgi:collagenase-like PrtC family protease